MFTRTVFHLNSNFNGLFSYLRTITDLKDETILKITSPVYYEAVHICASGLSSSDQYSLVDGNKNVCWANYNMELKDSYFVIDLKNNSFQMTGFAFETICCHPQVLEISAGKTENTLQSLGKINGIHEEYKSYLFEFSSRIAYRFFKISMPEPNSCFEEERLQFKEIEFYGILNPMNYQCSHQYINKFFLRFIISLLCTQIII